MIDGLVEAAISLEGRMRSSALHRLRAFYTIGPNGIDPTAVNFLFGRHNHMVKAKRLELAYAAALISEAQFNAEFPKALYLAVNGHYCGLAEGLDESLPISEGVELVKRGYEALLTEITVELCFGSGWTCIPDDGKTEGDLVLGFGVSHGGTVSEVWKGLGYEKAPVAVRIGESALEAFGRLESCIIAP